MWRCANDLFAYCYKEPDWKEPPQSLELRGGPPGEVQPFQCGGTCVNNPETCSYHLTLTELLAIKKGDLE